MFNMNYEMRSRVIDSKDSYVYLNVNKYLYHIHCTLNYIHGTSKSSQLTAFIYDKMISSL